MAKLPSNLPSSANITAIPSLWGWQHSTLPLTSRGNGDRASTVTVNLPSNLLSAASSTASPALWGWQPSTLLLSEALVILQGPITVNYPSNFPSAANVTATPSL